jgi:hypothetical protein
MNIRTSKNPTGDKTFTEDVLKIEKCGPDEDYLTVIDVPGIFRATTEGITTNKDKDLVRNMVKEYIRDSRTIILAVLPSNVDVATQEILALAEDYDKTGERTLGILTKPDLVKERSAKLAVCSLVEGKRKPLTLGYYIVRNRGGDDDDDDVSSSLSLREALFHEHPWSSLPDDRVGVVALRGRLQELLGQITDRAFPQLRSETRKMLEDAQNKADELGPPRQTEREQQQYLVSVAGKFQNLVRAALDADYSIHPAFAKNELRLVTAVVNITDQFNTEFSNSSRTYFFETEIQPQSENIVEVARDIGNKTDDSDVPNVDDFKAPEPENFPELERIIVTDWTTQQPKAGIINWIESVYRCSRGIELGTFGPGILSSVFRAQSEKWGLMTEQYLSKIILVVHRFILMALDTVCTDSKVREELKSTILSDLLAKYADGMKQSRLLVDVERRLKPYTLNHYFNSNLQKSRGSRVAETLRPLARKENSNQWGKLIVELDSIKDAVSNKSNTAHAQENIHDILEAYYKVAYKRFVDNVFHQAVNYKLLSGPENPLQLFSEQWVLQLDAEKLVSIAGESRLIRDRRESLQKKIQDLEDAMRILS